MLSCEEFIEQGIIEKCKIDNLIKLKKDPYFGMGNIHQDDNKKISILTPEIEINPYNKFSLDEKYGKKNSIYLKITEDKGMQQLLNGVFLPLDNFFESANIQNLLFPNNNKQKKYNSIAKGKNKMHFKIYNMKLTAIDFNNNMIDTIITENNINDINKYLTYKSKIKLILNIDKIWKMEQNFNYGIRVVCNHFLILNGTNINQNVIDKYTFTQDYDINSVENEEEIEI
jgi:hypothetical protein